MPEDSSQSSSSSFLRRAPTNAGTQHELRDVSSTTALTSSDIEVLPVGHGADPLIGRVVAERYRIRRRIGRGGMAVVYEVEHTAIGKLLAMKLLSGELTRSPEVLVRFEREALAASRLQCHSTVQVFDYGVSDGLTFLVMELLEGETLSTVLRKSGPMPGNRVAKIAIQICNALSEAHEKGVIHRDIKPDNVVLVENADGADVVKVLDFGLAKLREVDKKTLAISQGMILGTPQYMAPEQIRSEAVDERTDVYSLGALMYGALTGGHVFKGRSTEVLTAHLTMAPVSPCRRRPDLEIDPQLSDIVMRCLRKSPRGRPADAEELRALLADFLRSEGSSSVELLLPAANGMRRLERGGPPEPTPSALHATRDDVDAYERKLRKRRYRWSLAAVVLGLAGAAMGAARLAEPPSFDGAEREPNNDVGTATELPLGQVVSGHLGERIDERTADHDFYAVDVRAAEGVLTPVSIDVSALPNVGLCLTVYGPGARDPLGRWCGQAGEAVSVNALALPAGRTHLLVSESVPFGSGLVVENVSDAYRLEVDATASE